MGRVEPNTEESPGIRKSCLGGGGQRQLPTSSLVWWCFPVPLGIPQSLHSLWPAKPRPRGAIVCICGGNHQLRLGLLALLLTHLLSHVAPAPEEATPWVREAGGIGPDAPLEARAAKVMGMTPEAQVPRSPPRPIPWSLPAHSRCTSCLQFPPTRRLRVCLISHLWPLGWDIAHWAGGPGTGPIMLAWCL